MAAKESDRYTRSIRKAVVIRKTGNKAMNHDIGTYNLSHTYDSLLLSADQDQWSDEDNILMMPRTNLVSSHSPEVTAWRRYSAKRHTYDICTFVTRRKSVL